MRISSVRSEFARQKGIITRSSSKQTWSSRIRTFSGGLLTKPFSSSKDSRGRAVMIFSCFNLRRKFFSCFSVGSSSSGIFSLLISFKAWPGVCLANVLAWWSCLTDIFFFSECSPNISIFRFPSSVHEKQCWRVHGLQAWHLPMRVSFPRSEDWVKGLCARLCRWNHCWPALRKERPSATLSTATNFQSFLLLPLAGSTDTISAICGEVWNLNGRHWNPHVRSEIWMKATQTLGN